MKTERYMKTATDSTRRNGLLQEFPATKYPSERIRNVQFYDLGLQLALINQLMFKEQTLVPKIPPESSYLGYTSEILIQEIPQHLLESLECLEIDPSSRFYKNISIMYQCPSYIVYGYIKLFDYEFLCPDNELSITERMKMGLSLPPHQVHKMSREEKIKIDLSLLPNLKEINIIPYKIDFISRTIEEVQPNQIGFDQEVIKILEEKNIKVNVLDEKRELNPKIIFGDRDADPITNTRNLP